MTLYPSQGGHQGSPQAGGESVFAGGRANGSGESLLLLGDVRVGPSHVFRAGVEHLSAQPAGGGDPHGPQPAGGLGAAAPTATTAHPTP